MKICNVETREHINNLSCIFDKFADKLSLAEKESLNAAMHLMDTVSLPSWERGLKSIFGYNPDSLNIVAPLAGARIEICPF